MEKVKRYILTGAPGTGKTSVLEALRKKGYSCFSEVSRKIIKEQQLTGGKLFPWDNLSDFAMECYERMTLQLKNAQERYNFFDRAIPDNIAYLTSKNLKIDNCYYSQLAFYEKEVLYFPVWPAIFTNDPQRPESLERAYELDYYLKLVYKSLDFNLIEMKPLSINQRVCFIEKILKQFEDSVII